MKVVLQRVRRASVKVFDLSSPEGNRTGEIGRGLVLLAGFRPGDNVAALARMAKKILELRIFEDEDGKMNRSVTDLRGDLLVVSQFTLYGDTRKGRRPSFTDAMAPEEAGPMYRRLVQLLSDTGLSVTSGVFGAKMEVEIINDGPVTILLTDDPAPSEAIG